jgi:hypothetical protein
MVDPRSLRDTFLPVAHLIHLRSFETMATWGIAEVKINLGNLELGVLIATLLFGASMVQTFNVLLSKSNGQKWLKPLVAAVLQVQFILSPVG